MSLAGPSLSDTGCQVRALGTPCLARPVVEVAMFVPDPLEGMVQRSVRACADHHAQLTRRLDERIVAVRPYRPETAP